MAIKAFTRKTSGPTSSEEFLKDYENLLKRNRGGGSVVGYDTSSNTPMYLGTSVADPMGLGQTVSTKTQDSNTSDVSQTVELFNQVLNSLTDNVDSNDVIQVYEFLDNYFKNELPNLTDEQKQQILPTLGNLVNRAGELITGRSDTMNAYKMGYDNPYSPIPANLSGDDFFKNLYGQGQQEGLQMYNTKKTVGDISNRVDQMRSEVADSIKSVKQMNYDLQNSPKYESARQESNKWNETKQRLINEGKINEFGQRIDENGNVNVGWSGSPDTSNIGEVVYKAPDNTQNVLEEFKNWLGGAKDTASNVVKNVRGAVGDTIDAVAYAIPGTSNRKDTGFSEWVAGRNTPHTLSAAEPETLQAGTGLTRLREDMSYSPTAMAGRPDFSQIGLKRAIGNVAGIQDQSALTPKNNVSPDGQSIMGVSRFSQANTPTSTTLPEFKPEEPKRQQMSYSMDDLGRIVDAMMSKGYNNRAEAEAVAKADINKFGNEYMPSNSGVGSNQPSSSNSSSSGSSYQQQLANTYTAPTTSNNAMSNSNIAKIGTSSFVMPTVGIGSNQPSTSTSSSSSSSSSLLSTISNLLSNLFRRK